MKKLIFKAALIGMLVGSIPAHAMLIRAARTTALHPNLFGATTETSKAILTKFNMPSLQSNNRLLARALTTQQHEHTENQFESEENANDSGSNNHGWNNFRKATPALGFSIFGAHLWWSEDDICQTPEDFQDLRKWQRTEQYFQDVNPHFTLKKIRENINVVKTNPETLDRIFRFVLKNFVFVINEAYGQEIISEILEQNPRKLSALANPIAEHIEYVKQLYAYSSTQTRHGCIKMTHNGHDYMTCIKDHTWLQEILEKFKEEQPHNLTAFIKPIKQNFAKVVTSANYFVNLIKTILEFHPDALSSFIQPAIDNFAAIIPCDQGTSLIITILEQHPETATAFAQPALDNFSTLALSYYGCKLITDIMKHKPGTAILFAQPAADNFLTLVETQEGMELIKTLIILNSEALPSFEQLAEKYACKEIQDLISGLREKESIKKLLDSAGTTQTSQHFHTLSDHNFKKIKAFFPKEAKCIQFFKDMISTIVATEDVQQKAGNYTFVHAYPWNIHFLQDIDAHLRSIVYSTPLQRLSLRFIKVPHKDRGNKYETVRKDILATGTSRYYARDGNKQKHMIFMNYALLANQYGSNTLQYIANDRCENPPHLLLDKIFKHLDLATHLAKYRKEIEELQALHRDASMFGAGILFAFTPEMLQESVYVCYGGGGKRKVRIYGVGETNDVKLILDTLRATPKKIQDLDELEFVFVITKDCALNPRVQEAEGYKTIPFNAADPEKLAFYEQKRDELITKIKADIDAERAAQSEAERTAHEKKLEAIAAWFAANNCLTCNESRTEEA